MPRSLSSPIIHKMWLRSTSVLLALLLCAGTSFASVCASGFGANSLPFRMESSNSAPASAAGTTSANSTSDVIPPMDITARGALIVSMGHGMILYSSQPDVPVNIPSSSKLMTAVIALESLALDTQVTISSEVETLDDKSENSLYLSKGEKCTVEYLVAAILYKDSDAAALSLAEYISIDEASFVTKMNGTAVSLGMSNTKFANTSGEAVNQNTVKDAKTMGSDSSPMQYTTLSDMSLLFRYALNMDSFKQIFTKYRTLVFLADGTPQIITSSMITAWGLNSKVKGASRFSCNGSADTSCVAAYAGVDDFEVAILLIGVQNDSVYKDLNTAIDTVYSAYEVSNLVVAGDAYRKVTLSGISQPVSAVFQNTVRYVHPVGENYILPDTVFIPSETVILPISKGEVLGQVTFELSDGTLISTDIVSGEDVWAKTTFVSNTIEMLQANRNLTTIIIISVVLLLFASFWSLFSFVTRAVRTRRIRRHRK